MDKEINGETIVPAKDEYFMREAMRLAEYARGQTSPNPLVGAVIVRNEVIVAGGWHRRAGEPHAEVHAINMAGELAKGATLYVTLEPCSQQGRTGPCCEAVIKAGLARVVVGIPDPNPLVNNRGIERLRQAGIEVTTGVLAEELARQNEIFLKWVTTKRPFVTVKTAMSLDGKIATATGESQWITNEQSRHYVQELRAESDAILVGIGTVLADNPQLTVRLPHYEVDRQPLRVVLDNHARTPLTSKLVTDNIAETLIFVSEQADMDKVQALINAGVEVIICGNAKVDLGGVLDELGRREISSLLVEGGGGINFAFMEQGLVDKALVFIAPLFIGGESAKTPVEGKGFQELKLAKRLENISIRRFAEDILLTGYFTQDNKGRGE